ncbi:MAG TPA: hypothetical protein VFJ51_02115 [Nitrososphaeraceae archaeon]|nr:hypothetical protein [Nitrososphaeraceae archaeon]
MNDSSSFDSLVIIVWIGENAGRPVVTVTVPIMYNTVDNHSLVVFHSIIETQLNLLW